MPGLASRLNGKKGGRPKGPSKPTLDKIMARQRLMEMVIASMDPMAEAQIKHAQGIKYLVKRSKAGGKFEKVSADTLEAALEGQDDGSLILEVWDKDPSVQAFTDLMNRALDKPKEQEQDLKISGELVITINKPW